MQAGSTGLGKVALKMSVVDKSKTAKLPPTQPPDDALVFYCKTWDPVVWDVWIGIEPDDVLPMLRLAFQKGAVKFFLRSLVKPVKQRFGRRTASEQCANQK